MEIFYFLVFGALSVVVAALELSKSNKDRINTPSAFNAFKNNYLFVYSLMMAGDWLQGPYVYFLYSQYGFDKGEIGQLFIAGFGSSMLFGTIVGSLADKQGRKRACITYCITYILSCITKHSPEYKRGFEQQWLSITFSKAIFLGNGLIAILAGLFGNVLVDSLSLGPVAPFDAAACFLAIGMAVIMSSWTENYGDPSENKDLLTQFRGAAVAIASDEKIALLGAIQSLFEGSMYTFVFLWTPALSPNNEDIPHGFIFATFMLASMLGSSLASRLMARNSLKVESYMQIVFVVSSAALVLPIVTSILVAPSDVKGGSISFAGCIQLLGFCVFESCVGIFWPSIMKMRSQYIPEEARSTIMNFFRIPLNIFVCVVLYNVDAFPITVMFGMCSIFLFVASILQRRLLAIVDKPSKDWRLGTGRKEYRDRSVKHLSKCREDGPPVLNLGASMAEYSNTTYSCRSCRNPLASGANLLSKSFLAKSGKAFLFSQAKNIVEGPKEQKLLITGIFETADIHCSICGQVLGWKYLKAYDIKQKFKEGKFIIETAKIVKEYD
ncbi:Molybdate-anion transporter [Cucurbita argyrosperma subsp. argyrosperma]|nr:Molybdate-anion transporter [Cucurbita argyrosperma subsp. argyrosperma]